MTGRMIDAVAADLLDEGQLEGVLHNVMDELFGAMPPIFEDHDEIADDDVGDDSEDRAPDSAQGSGGAKASAAHTGPGRLQHALAAQLGRPIVRERLRVLANQLCNPDPTRFSAWLRRLILETLGEATLQACIAAAPRQATVDTLLVDIHDDAGSGQTSVWITEATLGGAGVLQAFAERFGAEPRIFFTALEAALAPTDLELVDGSLREILALAVSDAEVADHMARLRGTNSHSERATFWASMVAQIDAARRHRPRPCLVGFAQQPLAALGSGSISISFCSTSRPVGTPLKRVLV